MAGYVYAPNAELDPGEVKAIESVARDYCEAWYTGDAERMALCLHPEWDNFGLVNRVIDTRTQYVDTEHLTHSQQVQLTGTGAGVADPKDRRIEITVLTAKHHLASVKVVLTDMTDLLHLIRFPEGWKIVHTVWTLEGGVIANATTDI
jgi:hypothetical protein